MLARLRRAPRSVQVGLAVFVIGLAFAIATVLPYFFGEDNRSLWINLGCMLLPLGFVVAIVGAVQATRAEQRAALAELSSVRPGSGPLPSQHLHRG